MDALDDLNSLANFPGAADHCRWIGPSINEDFSCLLCCSRSCLALSSPSLHTSLWRKPYCLEGGPLLSARTRQRSHPPQPIYLLLDGGAGLSKYKLFCLLTTQDNLSSKIGLRPEKEFFSCITNREGISLRFLLYGNTSPYRFESKMTQKWHDAKIPSCHRDFKQFWLERLGQLDNWHVWPDSKLLRKTTTVGLTAAYQHWAMKRQF